MNININNSIFVIIYNASIKWVFNSSPELARTAADVYDLGWI